MSATTHVLVPGAGGMASYWSLMRATGSAEARRENDLRDGRDPDAPFDEEIYFLHDAAPAVLAELRDEPQSESDDRLFPYEFQQTVAQDRLEIEPIPGGHLCALSHPDELAEALQKSMPAGT